MSKSIYETAAEIPWNEDEWFAEHHSLHITQSFRLWWAGHYGKPSDYADHADDPKTYWLRCGFAWQGWKAGQSHHNPPKDTT